MGGEIPVIDMQQGEESIKLLREACEIWGCFMVVNHGVPIDLMAEIKSVCINLFDRPVEIKNRNKKDVAECGYLATSEINPKYEAFGLDVSSSKCLPSFFSDLDTSPRQREVIEMYYQGIQKLGMNVARKMAESMGLKDDSSKVEPLHIRINKYATTQETVGSVAMPKHTDSSLFTILQDDEDYGGGLEIIDPSGNLVAVNCSPGALFVLFGDIALPWSNEKLQSVEHRVVCNNAGIRLSIATLCAPPNDELIVANPKFITSDCQPKYKPFTYAEFWKLRASDRLYANEALELMRLRN